MAKKVVLAAMVLAACIFVNNASALNVNIDPPRLELSIRPGEEKSGFIVVQNKDEVGSMHIKAYVQDLVYLPDGSNDFLPVNSTPWSLGDNIKVGPTEFDIAAGQQEMVRYVVSMPKDAKGGKYGVVFFEAAIPPSEFKKVGANVNVRIGTIILATAEGTSTLKVKMKGIKVEVPPDKKSIKVSCSVFNNSNVIARPNGMIKLIDNDKVVAAEVPINKERGGVLPNTARTYMAEYNGALKSGIYYAQVVLDYGGQTLLGGQTKFEIK